MKKQSIILLILIVFGIKLSNAQSIGPSTLNSTGGHNTIGGNTYEYSIGEMSLVNTASSSSIIVTQGILQPSSNTSKIQFASITDSEMKVFPVPTASILNIHPAFSNGGVLHLNLLDAAGKNVVNKKISLSSGKEMQQLDIQAYASGNYLLNISYETPSGTFQKVFKIQKTQ